MAKRGFGPAGRVFVVALGLLLVAVAGKLLIDWVVAPGRALVQGDKTTVTITRCAGAGDDQTCFASWSGKDPGSGQLVGTTARPGAKVDAFVREGHAYPTELSTWYPRVMVLVLGLGLAMIAIYLLTTALGLRSR